VIKTFKIAEQNGKLHACAHTGKGQQHYGNGLKELMVTQTQHTSRKKSGKRSKMVLKQMTFVPQLCRPE
jgi:hypothetical protein